MYVYLHIFIALFKSEKHEEKDIMRMRARLQ